MRRVWWNVLAAATLVVGLLLLRPVPIGARFNFRKSVELQDDVVEQGHYQAFIFIKNLKVGGSTMAGIVRQFMYLKWGTTCIEPMRREFTLSGKDGDVIMMTLALWAQKERNSSAAVDSLSQFNASQAKTLGAAAAASAAASSETHRLCAANHGTRRTVYPASLSFSNRTFLMTVIRDPVDRIFSYIHFTAMKKSNKVQTRGHKKKISARKAARQERKAKKRGLPSPSEVAADQANGSFVVHDLDYRKYFPKSEAQLCHMLARNGSISTQYSYLQPKQTPNDKRNERQYFKVLAKWLKGPSAHSGGHRYDSNGEGIVKSDPIDNTDDDSEDDDDSDDYSSDTSRSDTSDTSDSDTSDSGQGDVDVTDCDLVRAKYAAPFETDLNRIINNYHFVAVTERMDESLIVLRHLLNLTYQHIAYLPMKVNTMVNSTEVAQSPYDIAEAAAMAALNGTRPQQKYKDEPLYETVRQLAELSGDTLLYEKANAWLDAEIVKMGPVFRPALERFIHLQREIHGACQMWEGHTLHELNRKSSLEWCYWNAQDLPFNGNGCGYPCINHYFETHPDASGPSRMEKLVMRLDDVAKGHRLPHHLGGGG
eukprot:INCI7068.1.p1 GENE.INCI7068.1~~INCI7068.1.p1  ORF type:complete len:595 (+),score=106.59 INCI7068.1:196-1980(+)